MSSINTALYRASRSYGEILNYLSRNFGKLKELIETGASGGDSSKLSIEKVWIPAFSMLPTKTDPAYYLENTLPAQVFHHTTDDGVKIIINADEIPDGTTQIKFMTEAYHLATTPADRNVKWEVKAGWYSDNVEATAGTEAAVTMTLTEANTTVKISDQSAALTIAGTKGTHDKIYIELRRAGTDVADTLDSEAYCTRINLEFVTV